MYSSDVFAHRDGSLLFTRGCHFMLGAGRKTNGENRATKSPAFNGNPPAMSVDDSFDDGQTDTRAV
jgi:hypothetical protein